jgi:uncharacterized protein (TIGR03790 family)
MKSIYPVFLVFFLLLYSKPVYGLTPDETVVLVNRNAWHSIDLGQFYMKKRKIPQENILRLWTTDNESVSRIDYERQIVTPVKEFIEERNDQGKETSCLVIMYGMPLKISSPELTHEEKKELATLKTKKRSLQNSLELIATKQGPEFQKITDELENINSSIMELENKSNMEASLESELSLVKVPGYALEGWIANPLFLPFQKRELTIKPGKILLVSRLDGPDENTVKRIIDDSIEAENTGLKGTAYFDARWKAPNNDKSKKLQGNKYYDWSIHQTAEFFRLQKVMPVVLDDREDLFQKGDASHAAIYCGWYSLMNYVDAFKWQPGAIGFHIASGECISLKKKSKQWCRNILQKGASVTIGPVSEPYLQAFPNPELFFKLLVEGRLSVVESYYLSLPFLSWKMVLIGDPLYRPFKNITSRE